MIAGDQHPALGLVQDDVRGRVARRLVDLPGADVGLDLDPRHELAIGGYGAGDARVLAAAGALVQLEARRRDAALTRDLDPPVEGAVLVVCERTHVLPGGMHPQLAAGGIEDRAREAVMVGVGVGGNEQAHVLDPRADLGERSSSPRVPSSNA